MSDEVKLLPCPFCGKGAAIGAIVSDPPRYFVNCVMCQAVVGDTIGYCRQEDAAEAWNTRPTTVVTDEVVGRRVAEWIEKRRGLNKSDRREAVADDDNYSQAFATGALLELIELESFLFGCVTDKALASMPTVVTGEQPQGVGAIPGSHPADQAPSGLGASRFDPERSK